MPKGLKRIYGSGGLHYITCSCYRRQPFFTSDRFKDIFLEVFEKTRKKFLFRVIGYVVMPEHIHLLVSEPELGTYIGIMHAIKLNSAKILLPVLRRQRSLDVGTHTFNVSHFWQARWYDFNVRTEKKRIEKLKYIHRNPVKRGLVEKPEDWKWSSYRAYKFDEKGIVEVYKSL
jgi:putative transposase